MTEVRFHMNNGEVLTYDMPDSDLLKVERALQEKALLALPGRWIPISGISYVDLFDK